MSSWLHKPFTHNVLQVLLPSTLMLGMLGGGSTAAQAQPQEVAKLLASDGAPGDEFGYSVAIYGDTAVVGTLCDNPYDPNDPNGLVTGSAYVFRRDPSGDWFEEAKLIASDGVEYAFFGASVAIYGDTAVVGAPEDVGNGQWSGSAYVFRRDPSGLWYEEAKLLDPNGTPWDWFGASVAVHVSSGALKTVIGASQANPDDPNAPEAGLAYVFRRDSSGWVEEARLWTSDVPPPYEFGHSVAFFLGIAVIGAPSGNENHSGSAYGFRYHPSLEWYEHNKMADPYGALGDRFGASVALSGRTAAIGAPLDDGNAEDSGSAWIFRYSWGGWWFAEAKLLPLDGEPGDEFGRSVARVGVTTVVGAPLDDDNDPNSGSAYVFRRDPNDVWSEQAKLLASDGEAGDAFGWSMAASGDTALIGAPFDDDPNNGIDSGSAYVFHIPFEDQCPGDVDGDDDTDWSDLAILISDYGCGWPDPNEICIADLNGDGVTSLYDLAMLLSDLGCPDDDWSCDEPGPGAITTSVVAVDNSSVGPGDDPLEPNFAGGVTHFTFDLQVQIDPDEDWGAAEADALLTPGTEFFLHVFGNPSGYPPDPNSFGSLPALEFTSYWCAASVIPPGGSGAGEESGLGIWEWARTATQLFGLWYDLWNYTSGGPYTIGRYTIVVPPGGSATPPAVVPAGTGGDVPVIGTIEGWVTNASLIPGCDWFYFDIIYCGPDTDGDGIGDDCDDDIDGDGVPNECDPEQNAGPDCQPNGILDSCDIDPADPDDNGQVSADNNGNGIPDECDCPGDLDGDWDVDLSDLAQLLSNYGTMSGATYQDGDVDFDGDVDLADLAALLAVYGTSCP